MSVSSVGCRRVARYLLALGMCWPHCMFLVGFGAILSADEVGLSSRFFKQLSAPMTSVLDGNPFRTGLMRVTEQANLNLWLDRNVDPSLPINAGPLGPTVFAALEKLAASQQCVILPLANVVLVGRESWVDRTATAILSIPENRRGPKLDISWDALSTPDEALAAVAGHSPRERGSLPHDLWPAIHWREIDREVAIQLVHSQFDTLTALPDRPTSQVVRFTRRYPRDAASLPKLRELMQATDPTCEVRVTGDWLVAEGNIAAHRKATSMILGHSSAVARLNPEQATFTLKKMTTSAENAFTQLARAAGRTCVIAPDAGSACRAMVSVEGQDSTLRELVDAVASQVGVVAQWEEDVLRIQLRRK